MVSAMGTLVASFFGFNPFFRSHLAPLRDGPQNYLLSGGNREMVDVLARERIALVTPGIALFPGTRFDCACGTISEHFVGQTTFAANPLR